MIYDLIIIGSVPAGLTAAIYAARKKMNTLVLTKKIGGEASMAYTIENFPGLPKITGVELIAKMRDGAERCGAIIKEGEIVSKIEKKEDNFLIKTEKGDFFESKTIIIASGASPKKLDVPGAKEFESRGLSFCTICDAPIFAGKNVAVVGGGNAAFNSALDLLPYANKIYLLQHREKFIGDEAIMEKLRATGKVTFLANAEIREIRGSKFVEGLVYEDLPSKTEKELAIQGVFISIGQVPSADFAKDFLELNEKGEIIIDCATNSASVAGVFAAGDATNAKYRQYIIASGEGAKAALSAHEFLL